ncbi:MAG: glycosyltransferase, partial [Acidobacteriota bacterium]
MTPPNQLQLSVVIPAHNEEANLTPTVTELIEVLAAQHIPHEFVIVNDNSADETQEVAEALAADHAGVRVIQRHNLPGFGRAIRTGLAHVRGDVVIIVMADRSDDAHDVVRYYRKIEEGYDCVFGSRFRKGSRVERYPPVKWLANRIVNRFIQVLFWTRFNDLTNAFKAFRTEVIRDCGPFCSSHFNITIEISLSALIRKYRIAEIPIHWYGRTWGASNLRISQMGRRYLSVLLRMFFERMLIADDILDERSMKQDISSAPDDSLAHRVEVLEQTIRTLRASPPNGTAASSESAPEIPVAAAPLKAEPLADAGAPVPATALSTQAPRPQVIENIYAKRFSVETPDRLGWRRKLWQVLVDGFFSRWIPRQGTVLDFGCG